MAGSLGAGGRYNVPGEFGALYASLEPETAATEIARGLKRRGVDPRSYPEGDWWVYRVEVSLESVLDLTNSETLRELGVTEEQLTGDSLLITREIARQARGLGFQGLLVPSAARKGAKNLVIFADRLTESPRVVRSEAIRLAD